MATEFMKSVLKVLLFSRDCITMINCWKNLISIRPTWSTSRHQFARIYAIAIKPLLDKRTILKWWSSLRFPVAAAADISVIYLVLHTNFASLRAVGTSDFHSDKLPPRIVRAHFDFIEGQFSILQQHRVYIWKATSYSFREQKLSSPPPKKKEQWNIRLVLLPL